MLRVALVHRATCIVALSASGAGVLLPDSSMYSSLVLLRHASSYTARAGAAQPISSIFAHIGAAAMLPEPHHAKMH
ncbi:hypothetical protein B0H14DRAFT_2722056 [Mycena olivaceomarginata]|nr:hypothetical protein B0H14DRAFT_2722056 [Mycena olivaceomarginata]